MTSSSGPADLEALLSQREWVRRVARALARDDASADDAEQDAWLAAMRAPPGSASKVHAWFRTVLRRGLIDSARRGERRRRREEAVARPETQQSAAEIVARAEAHRAVVDAVFALDEPWRTTVVLRHFEDLSPAEIGERLGLPADTIRARLRRAHDDLRRRLAPGDDERRGAWLLLLPVPHLGVTASKGSVSGGMLVASSTSKAVGVAACALLLLAGAAFWAVQATDSAGRQADATASSTGAEAVPAAAARAKPGPRDVREADAKVAVADPTRAVVTGDVRFVSGDRPAGGVVVELRGPKGATQATTDATGTFVIVGIAPGGPYAATAANRAMAPATAAGIRLEAGETRRVDTLWLDEPVRVNVRVVAPDGSPVADATVEAYRQRSRIERQDWRAVMPEPAAQATSDTAGRAHFAGIAVGTWSFRGIHPDHAPAGSAPKTVLRGGVALDIVLRLEPGHELSGVVTGNDGRPLADVLVLALPPVEADLLMVPKPIDPLRVETTTDAAGRYSFRALANGEHSIAVVLPGTLPARMGVVSVPSVTEFDIHLDGATLKGRVTEEGTGRAVAGALVRAAVWRSHSPTYLTALTDADGRYAVAAPMGGILQGPARGEGEAAALPVHFDVEKDGYTFAPEASPVPWRNVWVFGAKDAIFDAVLRPAASLSGTVTAPDGAVAGAEVTADVWSPLRGSLPHRTVTDATGHFRFPGLPQGKARVVVARDGFFQAASAGGGWRAGPAPDPKAVVEIPPRGDAVLDVRLERGAALRGVVVDRAGAVVPAATVECVADGAASGRATTDAAGAFAIDGARPGIEVTLRATCDGFVDAEAKAAAGADGDPLRIVMARSGSVRGRVLGPDGQSAPGAWVQIAPAKLALDGGYEVVGVWQHAERHPVTGDGSFAAPIAWFGGAAADGVVARAGAPGLAPAISARLPVPGDADADAGTLRLAAGLRMEGRVVAADGSGPVVGAVIEFQNERLPPAFAQRRDWSAVGRDNTPFETVGRTGADGRFVIDGLPEWRYELRVSADGFGWAAPTIAVPQEAPVNVELPRLAPLAGHVEFDDGAPGAEIVVIAHCAAEPQSVYGFVETNADGSWELPFLPGGMYTLEARRPSDRVIDVLPTTTPLLAGGKRDVKIVVKRGGGRIAGRCSTPEGAAVPGAVISLKPAQGGAVVNARSTPDGRFEAAGLPDGTWTITGFGNRSVGGPEAFGRQLVTDAIEAPIGARDLVLEFRPSAPIRGRIVREDGGVPAGALLVQGRRGAAGKWMHFGQVGSDGAFTMTTTSSGTWTLAVVDRNTGTPLGTSGVTEFAGGATDVRIVVVSSSALSGRVTDDRGRGVAGVRVVAHAQGVDPVGTVTDAEGRFLWTGLAAGPWTVEAILHETGRAEATGLAPGGPEIALSLRATETISARIVGADDKPLRGADVTLAAGDAVVARLRTDADGRFVTRALPSGEYVVTVTSRDGRPVEAPLVAGRVRSGAGETVLRI